MVRRLVLFTAQSFEFRFQFGEASLGFLAQAAFLLGALVCPLCASLLLLGAAAFPLRTALRLLRAAAFL
jgi:hypothetical protein